MLALVVVAPPDECELIADVLWSLGVVAIEERPGTDQDVQLWTSLGDDRAEVEQVVRTSIGTRFACQWRLVEVDESVADSWRDHAGPTWVEPDLVVVPAWIDVTLRSPDPSVAIDDVTVITIEPGATFGAGDHPTTVLSLRALRRVLRGWRGPAATVLDVGCGSGVLSVAAVVCGAGAARGIDIAPAAVPITIANAQRNGVADLVSVSNVPLCDITERADVVLANILAPTLIQLADDLIRVMGDDGTLVVSGVLVDRFEHVVRALTPLRVECVDELDGWAAVTLRR